MNFKISLCCAVLCCAGAASAAFTNFVNFETAPVHPIALGPNGRTLAICNLPDNRVELFDVSSGVPTPIGNVAVGLDPVATRFASSNELWVVNHISSTISIVDVAAQNVVATLETPAGPSDVVFAGTPRRAWVSCSRTNTVSVIDVATRTILTNLTIDGERPRAMATSPDGSQVYVAIFESGNGTTVLGRKLTAQNRLPSPGPVEATNGPYGGLNPPPNSGTNFFPVRTVTNPPPRVSHIVRKNSAGRWMDDNEHDWTEWVSGTNAGLGGRIQGWDLPDHDVAIIVDGNGNRVISQPLELPEGPSGLALDESRERLYVWNHFASSISVVDTAVAVVVTNVPVFNPTPAVVQRGRRHLYDTRDHSGLGYASCASCHVDARFDRLAWDLGDPTGTMRTNTLSTTFAFHPMKGPLATQTFQDIITPSSFNGQPRKQQLLHWRGDRNGIEEFNSAFTSLLANDVELTTNEMADFKQALATIFFPPNFYRTFSNTLPATLPLPGHFGRVTNGIALPLPPGRPQQGLTRFLGNLAQCTLCHSLDTGRNDTGIPVTRNDPEGTFQFSQLRSVVDKLGMNGNSTNSRAGFGLLHDGRVDTPSRLFIDGFSNAVTSEQFLADMVSFLLVFSGSDLTNTVSFPSQDVPAAAGRQITFASNVPPSLLNSMLILATRTNSRSN